MTAELAYLKVGFTGTRQGMTREQSQSVRQLLHRAILEFHHGDCVGADNEAANIAAEAGIKVICHPPSDRTHQAENDAHKRTGGMIYPPLTHFARNRQIVDSTDVLVATPRGHEIEQHGGTAYTVRYAQKRGKLVWVVWPDGKVEKLMGGA